MANLWPTYGQYTHAMLSIHTYGQHSMQEWPDVTMHNFLLWYYNGTVVYSCILLYTPLYACIFLWREVKPSSTDDGGHFTVSV